MIILSILVIILNLSYQIDAIGECLIFKTPFEVKKFKYCDNCMIKSATAINNKLYVITKLCNQKDCKLELNIYDINSNLINTISETVNRTYIPMNNLIKSEKRILILKTKQDIPIIMKKWYLIYVEKRKIIALNLSTFKKILLKKAANDVKINRESNIITINEIPYTIEIKNERKIVLKRLFKTH